MFLDLDREILEKLLLAGVLGGLVGAEREFRRKPAGLRTNLLMCIGSALFTILSQEFARRFGGDYARIAAQIPTGIGFIGAGAILRERGSVAGLTTAATIFVVASAGMAVGVGLYATAIFTTALVLAANVVLGWTEDRFGLKTHLASFRLTTKSPEEVRRRAQELLAETKLSVHRFQSRATDDGTVIEFDAEMSYAQQQHLVQQLSSADTVCEVVPLEMARE